MYRYDAFDRRLVHERVEQFRDQTRRFLTGELSEDDFRPLRLQNGLYIQKHAPMLRISIPYGLLSRLASFFEPRPYATLAGDVCNDAALGNVIGPSFAARDMPGVIARLLETYVERRRPDERFIDTVHRVGIEPFKERVYATPH